MKHLVVVLIVLAGILYGAMRYHYILLDSELKVLQKNELTFTHTFVDARGTKKFKLLLEPDLISAGFKDLMKQEGFSIKAPDAS